MAALRHKNEMPLFRRNSSCIRQKRANSRATDSTSRRSIRCHLYVDHSCCHLVQRADHAASAAVEDVGVDHGGAYVGVAEQFLYGTDVVAVLQQVGGERMPERMRVRRFVDTSAACGFLDVALDGLFVDVVAAGHAAAP